MIENRTYTYKYLEDMKESVRGAESELKAANRVANSMAALLCGRLRYVTPLHLNELKKELKRYNMATREWK